MYSPFNVEKNVAFPQEENGAKVSFDRKIFSNWGKSVMNKPAYTFYPQSITGVMNIVKWARTQRKRVRVAGYRHTWSHFFSEDKQVLISLLPRETVEALPAIHKDLDNKNQLQGITLVGKEFKENNQLKHLCRIGAATTNEQFRQWAIERFFTKETAWTLPLNVIMVEITFGGSNVPICHGAGITNKTLSDLVTEIEFINPLGQLQKVGYNLSSSLEEQKEGRELIKTAAGSLGVLGIITSITVKLDLMTHARMHPLKIPLGLAIPPPKKYSPSPAIPSSVFAGIKKSTLSKARKDFFMRCKKHYYSEWFWFSLHSHCWINTWKNDGKATLSMDYPGKLHARIQEIEEYILELCDENILQLLSAKKQAELLSQAAMMLLPANKDITTPLIDALHFRRGIHNLRVQDMEFEIPIPLLADGKLDFSVCQRAWWDAIGVVYEWLQRGKVPMRLPLEMRIMGGSEITIAPQNGHRATCAIEVLTLQTGIIADSEWQAFLQNILDKWSAYTDFQGRPLYIKPHWAKQWEGLSINVDGQRKDILEYLKEDVYKKNWLTFKNHLSTIALQGGYYPIDFKIFSNPLLDYFIFNYAKPNFIKPMIPEVLTPTDPLPKLLQLQSKRKKAFRAARLELQNEINDMMGKPSPTERKESMLQSDDEILELFQADEDREKEELEKLENKMHKISEKKRSFYFWRCDKLGAKESTSKQSRCFGF